MRKILFQKYFWLDSTISFGKPVAVGTVRRTVNGIEHILKFFTLLITKYTEIMIGLKWGSNCVV